MNLIGYIGNSHKVEIHSGSLRLPVLAALYGLRPSFSTTAHQAQSK